jgi:hypothetical protein
MQPATKGLKLQNDRIQIKKWHILTLKKKGTKQGLGVFSFTINKVLIHYNKYKNKQQRKILASKKYLPILLASGSAPSAGTEEGEA